MTIDAEGTQRARRLTREVMEAHWRPAHGFCVPNARVYPWMWLWDSCFHSVIWTTLGDARSAIELRSVFAWQHADGFVPHMGYQSDPLAARALWGRDGASSITQPPMYAHALRVLMDSGATVNPDLVNRARRGLTFLMEQRVTESGLVRVVHPWETGADDSPRWDSWSSGPFHRDTWHHDKLRLLGEVRSNDQRSAVSNPTFVVAPASFNALVAFNLFELAAATGDGTMQAQALALAARLDERWSESLGTWVDWTPDGVPSAAADTLEALLPVLVTSDRARAERVFGRLLDPKAFGSPFGPAGVSRSAPEFEPGGYWRGGAWPQLIYLFWIAAVRWRHAPAERALSRLAIDGALMSGFSEYWDPLTGEALGATPQSWTGLAVACDRRDIPMTPGS